jgi:hypothetical protein
MHILVALVCLAAPDGGKAVPDDLLALIREGHRNSRELIRTLHTDIEWKTVGGSDSGEGRGDHVEGIWWEDGPQWRLVETRQASLGKSAGSFKRDTVSTGPVQSSLLSESFGGQTTVSGSFEVPKEQSEGLTNPWSRALFVLSDLPRKTLSDLLDEPGGVKAIEPVTLDGAHCYKLTLDSFAETDTEVIVDASRNYVVRRFVKVPRLKGRFARIEQEITEFQEPAPGIFFPKAAEIRIFTTGADGKPGLWRLNQIGFRKVEVNRPIDPAIFKRGFPEGIAVGDLRNGTLYIWGKDKPASAPMPLPQPAAAVTTETSPKANRPLVLILLNLALITGAAIAWLIYRVRTRQSGATEAV